MHFNCFDSTCLEAGQVVPEIKHHSRIGKQWLFLLKDLKILIFGIRKIYIHTHIYIYSIAVSGSTVLSISMPM